MWSGMLQEMFREKESLIASLKSSRAREEAALRDQSALKERVQAAENGRDGAEKALREYKDSQKKFLREKQVAVVFILFPKSAVLFPARIFAPWTRSTTSYFSFFPTSHTHASTHSHPHPAHARELASTPRFDGDVQNAAGAQGREQGAQGGPSGAQGRSRAPRGEQPGQKGRTGEGRRCRCQVSAPMRASID